MDTPFQLNALCFRWKRETPTLEQVWVPGILAISIVEDGLEELLPKLPAFTGTESPPPSQQHWDVAHEALRRLILKQCLFVGDTSPQILKLLGALFSLDDPLTKQFIATYLDPWHPLENRCVLQGPCDFATFLPLPSRTSDNQEWITVARFGHWRDKKLIDTFQARFGPQHEAWRWGYSWDSNIFDYRTGIQLYEEGYYKALKSQPELLDWVMRTGNECYDTAISNIGAFCDYSIQEVDSAGQHWQDVSVRRSLIRLGQWFCGDHPIQIRGHDSEGYRLNPSEIQFHLPDKMARPRQYGWWKPDSIEDFSMSNFVLQVKASLVCDYLDLELKNKTPSQEALETILYAGGPAPLFPTLTNYINVGSTRTFFFVARSLLLCPDNKPSVPVGLLQLTQESPKLPGFMKVYEYLAGLTEAQLDVIDRLLYYDIRTRKLQIDELFKIPSQSPGQMILDLLLEDPGKHNRNKTINFVKQFKKLEEKQAAGNNPN